MEIRVQAARHFQFARTPFFSRGAILPVETVECVLCWMLLSQDKQDREFAQQIDRQTDLPAGSFFVMHACMDMAWTLN